MHLRQYAFMRLDAAGDMRQRQCSDLGMENTPDKMIVANNSCGNKFDFPAYGITFAAA
jgi:hypothetical protein